MPDTVLVDSIIRMGVSFYKFIFVVLLGDNVLRGLTIGNANPNPFCWLVWKLGFFFQEFAGADSEDGAFVLENLAHCAKKKAGKGALNSHRK